jgi:hypothetical protein
MDRLSTIVIVETYMFKFEALTYSFGISTICSWNEIDPYRTRGLSISSTVAEKEQCVVDLEDMIVNFQGEGTFNKNLSGEMC